jgi:hypothetical protein
MKNQIKYLWIAIAAIAVVLIMQFLMKCNKSVSNIKGSQITDEKVESSNDNPKLYEKIDYSVIDKSPENDEISGQQYRNKKYKFRLDYPVGFEIVRGGAQHTVFKAAEKRLGAAFTITVMQYDDPNLARFNHEEGEYDLNYFRTMLMEQGINPVNMRLDKTFLINFPSYTMSYDYILRSQSYEIPYRMKQIQCVIDGGLYTIGVSMPQQSWTEEMEYAITTSINSFRFELY